MRKRESQALEIIRAHQGISRSRLAEAMEIAPRTAGIYCDKLHKLGAIKPTSRGRHSLWVMSDREVT